MRLVNIRIKKLQLEGDKLMENIDDYWIAVISDKIRLEARSTLE